MTQSPLIAAEAPVFRAAHEGTCAGCQTAFAIGDQIQRAKGGWSHAGCPPRLCPLDGGAIESFDDGFVVCTRCREVLEISETVTAATPETRFAYLAVGHTDTDPDDAPIQRLFETRNLKESA